MSVSAPTIDDILVAKMCAALRVELPAIVRAAVREEMRRAAMPPFVSLKRAHELTGLSLASARRRVADGTFVSKKVGGRLLVSTDSLKVVDEIAVARAAMKAVGE